MSCTKVLTAATLPIFNQNSIHIGSVNLNRKTENATPVKITFWRPEMGDNDIFQERGRSRYREYYLEELQVLNPFLFY